MRRRPATPGPLHSANRAVVTLKTWGREPSLEALLPAARDDGRPQVAGAPSRLTMRGTGSSAAATDFLGGADRVPCDGSRVLGQTRSARHDGVTPTPLTAARYLCRFAQRRRIEAASITPCLGNRPTPSRPPAYTTSLLAANPTRACQAPVCTVSIGTVVSLESRT